MKAFSNVTTNGNEPAIKRGHKVPKDGVNLAFTKAPSLNPTNNVVIVDTSQVVEENMVDTSERKKLYFANKMGILEDEDGSELVRDEFPFVTDVFSIDEDWSTVPGSEYEPKHILAFVHTSRFFHVDFSGLTMGSEVLDFRSSKIKVVNEDGSLYANDNGALRYRIRIAAARIQVVNPTSFEWAYRVFAYIDENSGKNLYLVYNKVELTAEGFFKKLDTEYKEIINPQPVFEYRPEESEIIESSNTRKSYYSTKPIALKENVLGIPQTSVDGYKVYVPKKAIVDPRLFQLFHWRVTCNFTQEFQVEASTLQTMNVGVVVTNSDPQSAAPYVFLNLERSSYNLSSVGFKNPLQVLAGSASSQQDKEQASYWYVNFDTVTDEQLKLFDILVWAPTISNFKLQPYQRKIDYFTRTLKKTLFIDTTSYTVVDDSTPSTTCGFEFSTGIQITVGSINFSASLSTVILNDGHPLISGSVHLGGWDIGSGSTVAENNNQDSIAFGVKFFASTGKTQYIAQVGLDWDPVVTATNSNNNTVNLVVQKTTPTGGRIIFSTLGILFSCSAIFDYNTNNMISSNRGSTAYQTNQYKLYVNGTTIEASMKMFYNAVMLAVKDKDLATRNETDYSSSWSYSTDWKASWVINASDNVLSLSEKNKYGFSLLPRDPYVSTPSLDLVWKRRLAQETVGELMDQIINSDPITQSRIRGAAREYILEITNDKVKTDSVIQGDFPPYAYTETYSPKFVVPAEIGAHVIREQEVKGSYGTAQYKYRSYPEQAYALTVRSTLGSVNETYEKNTVTWSAVGTATETYDVSVSNPASTTTIESEVSLSWWNNPYSGTRQFINYANEGFYPKFGAYRPHGLDIWQDWNYYSSQWGTGNLSWPYWGHNGRYQNGSRGEVVQFIQDILNRCYANGYFDTGSGQLIVDGEFGNRTEQAVRNFQTTFHARFVDGVVDAETWSILGYQIVRGGWNDVATDYRRLYSWAAPNLRLQNVSDGDPNTFFAKRSWTANGPSVIWEMFNVGLDQAYNIHAVTVTPYLQGDTDTLRVNSVAVRSGNIGMPNFDAGSSQLTNLPYRPRNGEEFRIDFGPFNGTAVTIGISQDGPAGAGFGGARFLGIRDIKIYASISTSLVVPGSTNVTKQKRQIAIHDSGSSDVISFTDKIMQAVPDESTGSKLSDIKWTSVTTNNAKVSASITESGKVTLKSTTVNTNYTTNHVDGPELPGTQIFYSMNEDGNISPRKEHGRISKADGIKLVCTQDGRPFGFPIMPTNVGENDFERQFGKLRIMGVGNDSTVYVGFWDKHNREFILNAAGESELTYNEWNRRGPQNIYIGVLTTYELDTTKLIPTDDDASKVPYREAMPVYGVYQKADARISLEKLPSNLSRYDVWPVVIKRGSFNRNVKILPKTNGYLVNYLQDFHGKTVRAFYSVPEADLGGYSAIFGPPYADIKNEEPMILADNLIQVRHTPIHMVKIPTVFPGPADPVRPVFTVYTRPTIDDPWEALGWSDIADYNVITGDIYLKDIVLDDPALIKIDYTAVRRTYNFKRNISATPALNRIVNLNPFLGQMQDLIGKPIYIYIVPEYVKDNLGNMISASIQDRTVKLALTPDIFDPLRSDYDPLAIMLGVIYITTAFDINDLVVLDTRRRGGGAPDNMAIDEITRVVSEASNYWDLNYGAGASYQKSGFIVVRLPAELKDYLTEAEIRDAIDRNITVGVQYKIEDLDGNEWN